MRAAPPIFTFFVMKPSKVASFATVRTLVLGCRSACVARKKKCFVAPRSATTQSSVDVLKDARVRLEREMQGVQGDGSEEAERGGALGNAPMSVNLDVEEPHPTDDRSSVG